jgi:hypothetical protein
MDCNGGNPVTAGRRRRLSAFPDVSGKDWNRQEAGIPPVISPVEIEFLPVSGASLTFQKQGVFSSSAREEDGLAKRLKTKYSVMPAHAGIQ